MKQGTGVVGELCKDVFIPKMVKVHQKFDLSYIKPEDIPGVVRAQLDRDIIASKIKPGMTIAIPAAAVVYPIRPSLSRPLPLMSRKKAPNRSYSRLWAVMAVLRRKDRLRL